MKNLRKLFALSLIALLLATTGLTQGPSRISGSPGSGALSAKAPVLGWYLGPQCPTTNAGNCFYTPANTTIDDTCSWATSSATVTCTDGPFTSAVTGMHAAGWQTCAAFSNALGSGVISTTADRTITYVSSTQVTLSANPSAAVTSGGCFIFGTPDDTGAAAAEAAYGAVTTYCPKLFLGAANYWFDSPHFNTQPPGCILNPAIVGSSMGTGNVFYAGGFELEGRGRAATTIYLGPTFPNGNACTGGCFVVPLEAEWKDFQISGGGNIRSPHMNGLTLIYVTGPGSLDNILCTNEDGAGNTVGGSTSIGFEISGWERLRQVDNSGCGTNAFFIAPGASVYANSLRAENFAVAGVQVSAPVTSNLPNFTCNDCGIYSGVQSWNQPAYGIYNAGGSVLIYGGSQLQLGSTGATNQQIGYYATSAGGSTATFRDTVFLYASGVSTNSSIVLAGTGTTTLQNVLLTSQSSGNTYKDVSGSLLFDQGGNTGIATHLSLAGQIMGEANSANITALTAAKLALGSGWGSTAAVTSPSGGAAPVQFTVTNSGTGQAASPTIVYTFPSAFPVSPFSCTATQVGGTNAVGTFSSSSLSATGVTFTFSLTPTASDTEIIQVQCVTP